MSMIFHSFDCSRRQAMETGSMRDEKWIGELQISGVYRLENSVVTGSLRSQWIGSSD
jgi:hypothetical protein